MKATQSVYGEGLLVNHKTEWHNGVKSSVVRIIKDDESQEVLLEMTPEYALEIGRRLNIRGCQ